MLTHGEYISDDICDVDLARKGAPCGGHKMCAVGTLWVAGGEASKYSQGDFVLFELPNLHSFNRDYAVDQAKPSTALAYELLNAAADKFGKAKGFDMTVTEDPDGDGTYAGELEILFEIYNASADDLLVVTKNAKRALTKMAAKAAV
jgi:hypothetical protein